MISQLAIARTRACVFGIGAGVLLVLSGPAFARDGEGSSDPFEKVIGAQEVYEENCAACHGYDGAPVMEGTIDFSIGERLEKSDSDLLATILNGKDDMPEWRDVISVEEQATALAYIRLLSEQGVIQEKCASCHEVMPHELLKAHLDGGLQGHGSKDDVCPGSEVEAKMSEQDFAALDRYLEQLSKLGGAQ